MSTQMSEFNSAYNTKPRVSVRFTKPSRAKQSFKDECNINNILSKWQQTGLITHTNKSQPNYATLASPTDYHQSLNTIMAAQEAFDALPSTLRTKFDNDPAQFLGFVSDPKNKDELQKLGLTNTPAPQEPSTGAPGAVQSSKGVPVGGSGSAPLIDPQIPSN